MDDLIPQPAVDRCLSCRAHLAHDQRYCLACGARRGPLPRHLEAELARLAGAGSRAAPDAEADADADGGPEGEAGGDAGLFDGLIAGRWLLTPRIASLAVMVVLSFGVIAGSLTTPGGAASLARTLIVAVTPPPAAPVTSSSAAASAGAGSGGGSGSAATPAARAPITITETTPAPPTPTQPTVYAPAPSTPSAGAGNSSSLAALPPIKHVFLIMLSGQGDNAAFNTPQGHPYLERTLKGRGELISNYYSVAGSSLANADAVISGQGPTQQIAENCPTYDAVTPGTLGAEGQAAGDGCVFGSLVQTLPDELTQNGETWRGYFQGMTPPRSAAPGQPAACRHPVIGSADANHSPRPTDPYVTWRNPFVYFQTLLNVGCSSTDIDLTHLRRDLRTVRSTPNFVYIAPDPCDDGSDTPCVPGARAGLPAADRFLRSVVPEILASPAYRQDGMLVITFDQAAQSGPNADSSSCCDQPTFPNLTKASAGGPTAPGSTSSTTAAAPTTTTTTTTAGQTSTACSPATSSSTTTAAAAATTTSTSTSATATSLTTTSSTTTSSTTTSSTTTSDPLVPPGNCTSAGTPAGGGQVGALVLSRYVKAGSVDSVSDLNHFSLLKTIEDLFSVAHLGYTQDASLPEFDSAVFNNPAG